MAVDPDKVEHQLASMLKELAPFIEGAAHNNILARMQSQVVPALIRWKIGEMNRATDKNGVLNAFVCFVASQMVSVVVEVLDDTRPGEAHFAQANQLMMAIGEEVGAIMTGERVILHKGIVRDPDKLYWDHEANEGRGAMRRPSTATSYAWLFWAKGCAPQPFHWIAPCRKRLTKVGDYLTDDMSLQPDGGPTCSQISVSL